MQNWEASWPAGGSQWEHGSVTRCAVWMQKQRATKPPAAHMGTSHFLFCHLVFTPSLRQLNPTARDSKGVNMRQWEGGRSSSCAHTAASAAALPTPNPPTIWISSHPLRQAGIAAAAWQHTCAACAREPGPAGPAPLCWRSCFSHAAASPGVGLQLEEGVWLSGGFTSVQRYQPIQCRRCWGADVHNTSNPHVQARMPRSRRPRRVLFAVSRTAAAAAAAVPTIEVLGQRLGTDEDGVE